MKRQDGIALGVLLVVALAISLYIGGRADSVECPPSFTIGTTLKLGGC